MQAYTGFSQVYDIFMDNVPYDRWTDYLTGLLKEYGVKEGLLLELGCGTGNITRRLAAKGYDMIGIDNSEEMLEIARDREYDEYEEYEEHSFESEYTSEINDNEEEPEFADEGINEFEVEDINEFENDEENEFDYESENDEDYQENNKILYLQQDMRSFELYGTVAAVVSICDSMNYITSEQDLLDVFKLVNNYLDANGIFIFDMNTEYKFKHILADNTIAENREDCSFIWDNFYDEDKMINEYDVTIFVKLEDENQEDENHEDDLQDNDELKVSKDPDQDQSIQLFERFQETHYQKAYSLETVKSLLDQAGMEFISVYDAFTNNPPTDNSERVYFIAREKHQDKKKYINNNQVL